MKQMSQQPSAFQPLPGRYRVRKKVAWAITVLAISISLINTSCKKFIEVKLPGNETYGEAVFENDQTATSAILGIYGNMISHNAWASGNSRSVTFLAGLSADELQNYSSLPILREFYENSININNTTIDAAFWDEAYRYIYEANMALEGLERSTGVTRGVKVQLQGEALFIRAFCHFYLVNLFGDVPYITTSDQLVNIKKFRAPRAEVYQHIIADLLDAQDKLTDNYAVAGGAAGRMRPNKWTVTALLARVYLYTANWKEADIQAAAVISQTELYGLDSLNGVFNKNSLEAIWQLMPDANTGYNTWEGKNFILNLLPASDESNSAAISSHLMDAFETGDRRRQKWIDSIKGGGNAVYYYPYKYKVQNGSELKEYSMVFRLAEQFLIRAEALARMGNHLQTAKDNLNMIRRRAGLSDITTDNTTVLLAAIEHERQVELFTEWGHRWLDLKRTNRANAVLSLEKAPGWQPTDTLYPIPQNERALNRNLTQNTGY